MGLLFKFSLVVLQMFEFSFSKKVFFRQDLERTSYLEWHQKEDFWWAFCNFLGIITHNFVKSDPKFEHKDLLHAKFYGAWHKKIFRSQICDIWGLGLKNLFRATWAQKTYQVRSLEFWLQLSQTGPHFLHSQNMNPIK